MPENKNPPENEQTKKPKEEKEKISRVGKVVKCNQRYCTQPALSLSSYCWKHTKDKDGYRIKIQIWARSRKSMKSFILEGADLSKLDFRKANLSHARFRIAKLSNAWLKEANLVESELTGADLSEAILYKANLAGANFWRADLSDAWLVEALLNNARLNWAKLSGAKGLTRENFSDELTDKEKKDAFEFKESYLTVKNYFIQNGLYDDASWAAFRERTLERIAWYNEIKDKGVKGLFSWSWWKTVRKWIGSHIFNLLCGYGEKPFSALRTSVAIVIFFSVIHYIFKWIQSYPKELLHWWDYLYFSIVTFTTLGYGDIRPLPAPGARMVASGEAFIGAFMIALFVWTLARRYVAR